MENLNAIVNVKCDATLQLDNPSKKTSYLVRVIQRSLFGFLRLRIKFTLSRYVSKRRKRHNGTLGRFW